jgi:hypothetical protein
MAILAAHREATDHPVAVEEKHSAHGEIHDMTERQTGWQETMEMVGKLNRTLRGWANYFSAGNVSRTYRALDGYTATRLRRWLRYKYQLRYRKGGSYPLSHL